MKIGVFTFVRACNYGAVLQAYALRRVLHNMGHEADVMNYSPRVVDHTYNIIPGIRLSRNPARLLRTITKWMKLLPVRIVNAKLRIGIRLVFFDFRKFFLGINEDSLTLDHFSRRNFDVMIVGSDQVWNIGLTGGMDPMYWGTSVDDDVIKIAYACSAGGNYAPIIANCECRKALERFDAISVREQDLCDVVSSSFGLKSSIVCDPTCLLTSQEWAEIEAQPADCDGKPYVLLYQIEANPLAVHVATMIAEKGKKRILEICTGDIYPKKKGQKYGVSPCEFLWLFSHADTIVTTSFHGTVFSVLNCVDFYSVGSGTKNDNRILDFLKAVSLSGRFLRRCEDMANCSSINFQKVSVELQDFRAISLSFIVDNVVGNAAND